MADQLSTSTTVSAIIPEVWSAKFYEVRLAKLPFNDSVTSEYEGEIQDLGDIVNISSINEFDAALDLAEGARGDAEAANVSGQQLTINKRAYKDFIVTKRAQLQSLPFVDKLRDRAAYAIAKKMHSDIIAAISPSAAAPDHQIAFDSGTTLALADILEAKELLDTADCEEEGRVLISGVAQYNDLFNIAGFTSRDYIPAGSPLTSGAIQTPVAGFQVKYSSEVGNVAYLFHPMFMSIAMQEDLNVGIFDLGVDGKRANRVNSDVLWGVKQLDDERVVKIG